MNPTASPTHPDPPCQNPVNSRSAAVAAFPLTFRVGRGDCFGWFHAASAPARSVGIVLCRPIGYEAICTNGCYTQLAEALALEGFDVIRFDYHGCGDSTGDDTDPDRLEAWICSITQAAHELRRLSGVPTLSFFGLRLGAALAVEAALRMGGVDSMVLWAPCAGKGFARELRVASLLRPIPAHHGSNGDIEALGFYYSAQTLRDLQRMDCLAVEKPPASRALILGRGASPVDEQLRTRFEQLGMQTAYAEAPGFAEMMVEPRETLMPAVTLAVLTQWLMDAYPLPETPLSPKAVQAPEPCEWARQGWRESAVHFGASRLFGILSEPLGAAPDSRHETAVLMLNVGGNYHIGPNRIYSRMARWLAEKGWRALRMDLGGIGDSRSAQGFNFRSLYARDSTAEVGAAIDFLAAKGCKRFYLMGICSGSFVAFQTAIADPRVTGQILMNSRLLEWREDFQSDDWQNSMQRYYKSTDFYRRALTRPGVYWRLLRGQVDVLGITRRIAAVLKARVKRAVSDSVGKPMPEHQGVLSRVLALAARNTDTLILMAAEDDGRDYVEFHFGRLGSRLQGNPLFRMVIVDDADHTFSDLASQNRVFAAVAEHIDRAALGASAKSIAPHKTSPDGSGFVSV